MGLAKYEQWLEPDNLIRIEGWARDGLTNEQIAHNIGIRRETLTQWSKTYPPISNALKKGKEVVDREVENALFKSAVGYDYEEVTSERRINPDTGEAEMVEIKRVTKHVQPNPTSMIFWLKNRKPEQWRERKDGESNNNLGGQVVIINDTKRDKDK